MGPDEAADRAAVAPTDEEKTTGGLHVSKPRCEGVKADAKGWTRRTAAGLLDGS